MKSALSRGASSPTAPARRRVTMQGNEGKKDDQKQQQVPPEEGQTREEGKIKDESKSGAGLPPSESEQLSVTSAPAQEEQEKTDQGDEAETETLRAAASLTLETDSEAEKKRSESFDIYNKELLSQMTFDASGHPILVPLRKSPSYLASPSFLPTTTTAVGSDDTDGEYEAVPPPQGSCAGLCPPYGALPEQMPLMGSGKEKLTGVSGIANAVEEARTAGEHVIQEGGAFYICRKLESAISMYTLPSRSLVKPQFPSEISCPVPLWQYLPPSPFVNREGLIGVNICAVAENLGSREFEDAIPLYDVEAVKEAEAAAEHVLQPEEQQLIKRRTGDDNFFKRLEIRRKSQLNPTEIVLD